MESYSKNKFEKLVLLVGFIIGTVHIIGPSDGNWTVYGWKVVDCPSHRPNCALLFILCNVNNDKSQFVAFAVCRTLIGQCGRRIGML